MMTTPSNDKPEIQQSAWNGFERLDFIVGGRAALLVRPRAPAPGRPWIWRMEFFDHEPQADLALLGFGFHLAYLNVQNLYGAPVALDAMDGFYDGLVRTYGLAPKTVLEGFSRGGLFAFNWAARHPDRVASLYVDAPVCDFKNWPGAGRSPEDWARCKQAYGLSEAEARAYPNNPVDNLAPLARADIPILSVCGEADQVVKLAKNSGAVQARYARLGGRFTLIAKPGCDHHPHSLRDPARIVNFILRHTPGLEHRATLPETTPYGYDYYALRAGLPGCRRAFERGRGRVLFLGGSITEGGAWRDHVGADLRRRFPRTRFEFINAGVASLGSVPHAFRLARDVLPHEPVDLLFVEAAVNDEANGQTPADMRRGMEGIVRRLRQACPQTGLVLLHFADPAKLDVLGRGGVPEAVAQHEAVAEHYGVASVNLAREVFERIHAGEFEWDKDFRDVHPSPFGHALYARSIGRLLDAALGDPSAPESPAELPARPLDDQSYFRGRLVSPGAAGQPDGWTLDPRWHPRAGADTRPGFVDVPALVSDRPGAPLSLAFEGTAVGLWVASGPDAGSVEFQVDGGAWESRSLFTRWSPGLHLPWAVMLRPDLEPGPHELVLRAAQDADPRSRGRAVRILHFLLN